jgi:hypothetical protein
VGVERLLVRRRLVTEQRPELLRVAGIDHEPRPVVVPDLVT